MRVEPRIVEELRKLGFERVEQLLTTERAPVARRFALDLYRRLDQALGNVPEPIEPVFAEAIPRARRRLLEPIATAEAFAQVIGDLAADLVGELVRAAKGARTLDLFFHRVDGHVQAVRVGTATPTRDPRHIAKLLTPRIETVNPGLGIEAMTLVAPLVEPFAASQSELDCSGKRGPDLPALVDTLANRFGQRSLYQLGARPNAMLRVRAGCWTRPSQFRSPRCCPIIRRRCSSGGASATASSTPTAPSACMANGGARLAGKRSSSSLFTATKRMPGRDSDNT